MAPVSLPWGCAHAGQPPFLPPMPLTPCTSLPLIHMHDLPFLRDARASLLQCPYFHDFIPTSEPQSRLAIVVRPRSLVPRAIGFWRAGRKGKSGWVKGGNSMAGSIEQAVAFQRAGLLGERCSKLAGLQFPGLPHVGESEEGRKVPEGSPWADGTKKAQMMEESSQEGARCQRSTWLPQKGAEKGHSLAPRQARAAPGAQPSDRRRQPQALDACFIRIRNGAAQARWPDAKAAPTPSTTPATTRVTAPRTAGCIARRSRSLSSRAR